MADIKIKVEGRIATNLTPEVKLVTKNDGYTVEFEFDETWSVSSLKTALFIANGHCIPVPFVGNVCNVPMIVGVELLNVGVKSDDVLGLQTTTAAKVLCVLSADDLVVDEIPAPSQSVYDRIVEMINAGMVKGEKGDPGEKGEKGDAGAIKFVTVVALPTENIDESTIYLVPIENPDGENRFTEYAYIDGKWETLGAISIQFDHSEYVKFSDYATANKAGVVKVSADMGTRVSVDGYIGIANATSYEIMNGYSGKPIGVNNFIDALIAVFTNRTATAYAKELTGEGKASACDWLGAVGKNEITALIEGKFVIATFDIIKDGPKEITLQNLTGMAKIDWGDGTVNNELTHSYKYNQDKAVNGVCKYTCKIYGVTSIGDYAFCECYSLTSVVIGDSVTTIGEFAFLYCSGLTSVVIPDSVMSIGNYAFEYCNRLTSVTIPDSVTSIGEWAFHDCDNLTSVVIPDSVTSIGEWAFLDCDRLTSVEFKSITPTKISTYAFSDTPLATIYVPNGTSEDYKTKWTENGVTEDVLQLIVEVESDRVAMLSDIKKLYEKLGL